MIFNMVCEPEKFISLFEQRPLEIFFGCLQNLHKRGGGRGGGARGYVGQRERGGGGGGG